jgi:hypothetical protein
MAFNDLTFHGNLTLRSFWERWFGNFGRELGSNIPHPFGTNLKGDEKSRRMFTDNIKTYLEFIDWCIVNKAACWITNQPMRSYGVPLGLEKLFFDFDYHLGKNENMTPSRREKVKGMVLSFVDLLDAEPLIVGTRKGYHVYIFLRRTYEVEERNLEFGKEVFGALCLSQLKLNKVYSELTEDDRNKWKYLDFSPLGDIVRMARVPLTPHEKSGLICQILDRNLKPTKIRDIDLFKAYGLREDVIREAVEEVKAYHKRKIVDEWKKVEEGAKTYNVGNGFKGQLRPCFTERLKIGEMHHQQRLALLMEAWWSGYKTEEQLMNICRNFKDYKEKTSLEQIRWFLKNKSGKIPPYKCDTIKAHGWCLKRECPIYKE